MFEHGLSLENAILSNRIPTKYCAQTIYLKLIMKRKTEHKMIKYWLLKLNNGCFSAGDKEIQLQLGISLVAWVCRK